MARYGFPISGVRRCVCGLFEHEAAGPDEVEDEWEILQLMERRRLDSAAHELERSAG